VPATQIFVQSDSENKTETPAISYQEHISEDLKNRISKIIDVTIKPRKYLGYSITKLNKSLSSLHKNLSMQFVSRVTGNKLIAEKIYLTNKSKKIQNLNLRDFIGNNHLAVFLTKEIVLPSQTCVLIRIIEN
jgi:hypothetical protein